MHYCGLASSSCLRPPVVVYLNKQERVISTRRDIDHQMNRIVLGLAATGLASMVAAAVLIEEAWGHAVGVDVSLDFAEIESAYDTFDEDGQRRTTVLALQSILMILAPIFCGLLHREHHLAFRNRRSNPSVPISWWRIQSYRFYLLEAGLNMVTSYPTIHPLFALFSFIRALHLFKLLRFSRHNKRFRIQQVGLLKEGKHACWREGESSV